MVAKDVFLNITILILSEYSTNQSMLKSTGTQVIVMISYKINSETGAGASGSEFLASLKIAQLGGQKLVAENDWILLVSSGIAIQHLNLLQNILLIQLILVPGQHK
jgi:hypothetical protein